MASIIAGTVFNLFIFVFSILIFRNAFREVQRKGFSLKYVLLLFLFMVPLICQILLIMDLASKAFFTEIRTEKINSFFQLSTSILMGPSIFIFIAGLGSLGNPFTSYSTKLNWIKTKKDAKKWVQATVKLISPPTKEFQPSKKLYRNLVKIERQEKSATYLFIEQTMEQMKDEILTFMDLPTRSIEVFTVFSNTDKFTSTDRLATFLGKGGDRGGKSKSFIKKIILWRKCSEYLLMNVRIFTNNFIKSQIILIQWNQ